MPAGLTTPSDNIHHICKPFDRNDISRAHFARTAGLDLAIDPYGSGRDFCLRLSASGNNARELQELLQFDVVAMNGNSHGEILTHHSAKMRNGSFAMRIGFYEIGAAVFILLAAGAAVRVRFQEDGKAKQQRETCLGNVRHLANCLQVYISDYDDVWPLSMSRTPSGSWKVSALTKTSLHHSDDVGWATSLLPYAMDPTKYVCPAAQKQSEDALVERERGIESSYTYNGLLHGFDSRNVAVHAELPVVWEGLGANYMSGHYASNPLLLCNDSMRPCVYAGAQGPAGAMYCPLGSMWIHGSGAVFGYADGHVKWKPTTSLEKWQGPGPIWFADPFAGYDEEGNPISYWKEDRHPILFKPDSEFSEKQKAQPEQLERFSN